MLLYYDEIILRRRIRRSVRNERGDYSEMSLSLSLSSRFTARSESYEGGDIELFRRGKKKIHCPQAQEGTLDKTDVVVSRVLDAVQRRYIRKLKVSRREKGTVREEGRVRGRLAWREKGERDLSHRGARARPRTLLFFLHFASLRESVRHVAREETFRPRLRNIIPTNVIIFHGNWIEVYQPGRAGGNCARAFARARARTYTTHST